MNDPGVLQIGHVNEVLRAIRSINRLIVRHQAPAVLVRRACEALVETRGYRGAWIAAGIGPPVSFAQARWGDGFAPVASMLERGQ